MLLALVGTTVGTVALGALVNATLGIPWTAALAFGALISATDPVAVIAFFKQLGTPKRLSVLVEGESLFNDAVAVVAFTLAAKAASGGGFTILGGLTDFVVVSAGGLAVGVTLGYLVGAVFLARVDDPLIETTTTLALAYGSYLVAEDMGLILNREDFHFSGILAVVAAGLTVGTVGLKNTSPNTRVTLEHFWELLTFLVNSMVFLVIGLAIRLSDLTKHLGAIGIALVGVLVVRVALVFGLGEIANRIAPQRAVSVAYRKVMFWGGLRGAISLALALTMTSDVFGDKVETVRVMTFGVVLFTLIIQGTTISGLIRRLGLAGKVDYELAQHSLQARIAMGRAGQAEVQRLGAEGVLFADMAASLGSTYERDVVQHHDQLRQHLNQYPELETAMLLQARRDALAAEQTELAELARSGLIDIQVAKDLAGDLNERKAALDLLEDRWDSDPLSTGSETAGEPTLTDGVELADSQPLVYVSWGGTGRVAGFRAAVGLAGSSHSALTYLAVVGDHQFGDINESVINKLCEELEWLLSAQCELVTRQVGGVDIDISVRVAAGSVLDVTAQVVAETKASQVLLGAPAGSGGHESVDELAEAVAQQTGAAVAMLRQGDIPT